MNPFALCQVTDEHLRLGVEVVGHNIEVTIVVEIEDGRRPTRSWCHHNRSSALPNAHFASQLFLRLPFLRVRAIDLKPGRVEVLAWLDTKHKFRIQEFFPVVIQQQGIDSVTVRIAHARWNKMSSHPSALRSPTLGPH